MLEKNRIYRVLAVVVVAVFAVLTIVYAIKIFSTEAMAAKTHEQTMASTIVPADMSPPVYGRRY